MVTTVRTKTLRDLIIGFSTRRNLAATTRVFYCTLLGNLEWYARSHAWPAPAGITREHMREFLLYVASERCRWPAAPRGAAKPAAPATVHHYGRVAKSLFAWACSEDYLEHNPATGIKLGSPGYREVEPYSDDEVYAMLAACEEDIRFRCPYLGLRNKAIISLLVATGLRVEELCGIALGDIDPHLGEVRVLGKGKKTRALPLNGEARKALKRYLGVRPAGGDGLWQTDDGAAMALSSVKIMIARLKRRAGVEGGGGAHRFRHYFATRYLEAGGDINSLRLLLGHSTLDMVLRYSRYASARRALEQHHEFNPLDRLYRDRGGVRHNGNSY